MNRTVAPPINPPDSLVYAEPQHFLLPSGHPVYLFHFPEESGFRLDLFYQTGTAMQSIPLQASFALRNLFSGSGGMSALDIAEALDMEGAYTDISVDYGFSSVSLYSTMARAQGAVRVFMDAIGNADFPDQEISLSASRGLQQKRVEKKKTSYWASYHFNKILLGNPFPGFITEEEDYENISDAPVREFYRGHLGLDKVGFVFTGNITAEFAQELLQAVPLGQYTETEGLPFGFFEVQEPKEHVFKYSVPGAIQETVLCGLKVPGRNHPDYFRLVLLNNLLGGFFGSRLMKNIREEKGLTYGIHSSIRNLKGPEAILSIRADIRKDSWELVLDEIRKEFVRFRETLVSDEELSLARNYLLGNIQRGFDGAFVQADKLKFLLENDLEYSYYNEYFDSIIKITPAEILQTANNYLNPDALFSSVSGAF